MKRLYLILFIVLMVKQAHSQTGIYVPSMYKADSLIKDFLKTWGIDGGTVAITKDGKLIYNRAFGYADQDSGEITQPYNLFRIASCSKPITSIAIMKLMEAGKLSLGDTVFGAGKIISDTFYLNAITDSRIYNITIKQLLEHTGGWGRDIACDGYTHCDPIGFPLHVTSVMGGTNPVADSVLIKFLVKKGLNYTPGTTYAYSNIGYLVLGKIIERKSGMKYEDYVKTTLFEPLGMCDIGLGKNLLADKLEREGEYNAPFTTLSCYGTGATVPWQYGGYNIEAMHAHGGWVATSSDLTRLILATDGFSSVPDILSSTTITTMRTPSTANAYYGKGWSVNSVPNWWHTGSLNGTATFICRTSGGYTWAILLNSRSGSSSAFWSALDALPWSCLSSTSTFPTHNLFAPSTNVSNLTVTKTGPTTVDLSWTNGNGDGRIVVATESNSITTFPDDGVSYTANAAFGAGQNLGNNTYVVYAGTGSSVSLTNLDASKKYLFTTFEYYNSSVTGNNAVYKYGCRSDADIDMGLGVNMIAGNKYFSIVPNPARDFIRIMTTGNRSFGVEIYDYTGRLVLGTSVVANENIDISGFNAGVYSIRIIDNYNVSSGKFVKY